MIKKIIVFITIFIISINHVYAKEKVIFSDCVDGDTFKILINDEKYTVRMLAIDTPESVHPQKEVEFYGKESSEYTCNKVKNASIIEIEYDPNEDQKDNFGRLLVWVFVDGELLQKNLIEKGYAKLAYLYDEYKYTSELEKVQELASAKNIGIWDEEAKLNFEEKQSLSSEKEAEKIQEEKQEYSKKEIIIIIILLLIVIFIGDKTIKRKAKKKLKSYLK